MASLLPLLQDLLPMIIPSQVHIARGRELAAVPERAEIPPWYINNTPPADVPPRSSAEHRTDDAADDDATSLPASQPGRQAGLINLVDHEECPVEQSTADNALEGGGAISIGRRYCSHEPTPDADAIGPRVLRKDAIVGVTDKMCATGKPPLILTSALYLAASLDLLLKPSLHVRLLPSRILLSPVSISALRSQRCHADFVTSGIATVLLVKPRSASAIHHHGEQGE